jgi:hypothetical protein
MTTIANDRIAGMFTEAANRVRKNWGWFLALGIIQIVAGMLAVGFAFSATLASVVTLGVLLLIAAGAQTAAAIGARDWSGFFLFLLVGVLYAVAGFLTLQHPVLAAEGLTLMLAAFFLAGGIPHYHRRGRALPLVGLGALSRHRHRLLGHRHLAAVARVGPVGAGHVRRHRSHRQRRQLVGAGCWRAQRGGAVDRSLILVSGKEVSGEW